MTLLRRSRSVFGRIHCEVGTPVRSALFLLAALHVTIAAANDLPTLQRGFEADGFKLTAPAETPRVVRGESKRVAVPFATGNEYNVIVSCLDGCARVSVGVLDPSGNHLLPPFEDRATTFAFVEPVVGGVHEIAVQAVRCPESPCRINVAVLGRAIAQPASKVTASAPPPSPPPARTAKSLSPPAPAPTAAAAAQPPSSPAPPAPAPTKAAPATAAATPSAPLAPAAASAPRASLQRAQQALALQFIDPARGTAKPFTGFAKALLGNCARRDEAKSEPFRSNAKIPLYLTASQGAPVCVVFQPDDRSSKGETCVMLPANAVDALNNLAEGMATEAACGDTPAWQVRFTDSRNNRPIAPGIVDEMILHVAEADKLRIAGVPVDRMTDGTYQAKLRLEDFGRLDKDAVTHVTGSELGVALRLASVRADHSSTPATILVTAEPLVVALDNKIFDFRDQIDQPALRCELSLDLDPGQNPKWGHSWDKLGDRDLILRLNADGRYALAIASRPTATRGQTALPPLTFGQLYVKHPKATDDSVKLKHNSRVSESACFLAEPSLYGAELESGQIKRSVGKAMPALARFILPDVNHAQARIPADDYIKALAKLSELTAEIGEWHGIDAARFPFTFHATVVATGATPKPQPVGALDQLRPSMGSFYTVMSRVTEALNNKVPAATLQSLRGHIRELFFISRGQAGGDRRPISIIAIGRVINDRGDSELCNAAAASRFENMRQEWMQPGTRQLLEVVFANRETINTLVRDGTLKEGSGSGTIFPCAHNSGNIEQYVVNVQRALAATGQDDILAVLHPAAQKLFGVRAP